jgi:hypothetical protein
LKQNKDNEDSEEIACRPGEKFCSSKITILRFYLTPLRIAIIRKRNITNDGKDAGKRNSYSLLLGM